MNMKHISQIKAKVNIFSSRKTSNLFDGSYRSIYQGNGLDFENLREYIPGDNIRDIDWKSSSRSGKMLVKRYVAEKKHNLMLVWDTGKKMTSSTRDMENKHLLALEAGGLIAYVAARNGDNVGAVYNSGGKIKHFQLRTGVTNVERILTYYEREKCDKYNADLEKSLEFIVKNIKSRLIICVVTDMTGIRDVSETTLKKLTSQHDVIFIRVGDTEYTGKTRHYDVERGMYLPEFFTRSKKLQKSEKQIRENLDKSNSDKLLRYRIASTELESEKELMDKIIDVLAEHKFVNSR